jgi:hypothetical protein
MDLADTGPAPAAEPAVVPGVDDYTVRVSRRTVRRIAVTGMVVLALTAGVVIGVAVGGSGGEGGPRSSKSAAAGAGTGGSARSATVTPVATAPGTTTSTPDAATASSTTNDGGASPSGAPAEEAPAAPDDPAAPVPASPPVATATVSLAQGRACGGAALTTSVTVEWHGTLGLSYFLQVNQANGAALMHLGVGSDGTETFPNVSCGLLPVDAQFVTNTATGAVYASAST